MCDPTMAIGIVMGAAQLYSGMQANSQAKAQARMIEDSARVNEVNERNEATRVRNMGVEKENDHRRAVAEMQSQQAAVQGASGVQLNTGSALQIREDTGTIGEVDALRIRSNYRDQAEAIDRGAELTRINGMNEASMTRAKGKSALTNSVLSAAGTVASSWYSPKSAASQAKKPVPQTSPKPNSSLNSYSSRGFA